MQQLRKHPYLVIPAILIALALLAYIGYFIVYNIYAFALFQFPFDYDQGEGFELVDTILFSQGQWPYRDNNVYPFYSSNYPPIFHLAIVPLVWLFGPHYWTGRFMSYLGTLITAGAITYAVERGTRRSWVAIISGLAYLASNYIYHVGPLFRQHLFMVMFETLAVVLLTIAYEREEKFGRKQTGRLLAVMALLLLAGYTKQLAYATVIAVFLFMFIRHPMRSIRWAIPFGLVTGLIFFGINYATNGHWYVATVVANINEFIPGQAIGLFRQWYNLHTALILLSLGFLFYQIYFERLSVYSVWFVIAVANSITAGKWGAGESYFATAIAASCICSGLLIGRGLNGLRAQIGHQKRLAMPVYFVTLCLIPLIYLWQANRMFHMPTHTPTLAAVAEMLGKPTSVKIAPQTSCSAPLPDVDIPYVDSAGISLLGRPPTAADTAAGWQIVELVKQGATPAFSEEAAFNLLSQRDVVTNPTQLLNLFANNQVDLTDMILMLDNREFDTIIFRAQFYPYPVLHTIGQNYQPLAQIQMNGFIYCILQPQAPT